MEIQSNLLKIGLVSEEFPPYMFGGIATVCRDLAFNLARKGVQTTVLCGSAQQSSIETPARNLTIVRLPLLDFPPRPLWFQIQNYDRIVSLLEHVDVFHAVNPLSAAIPMYLKRNLCVPCVVSIHGTYRGLLSMFVKSPLSCWTAGDIALYLLEYPMKQVLTKLFTESSNHFTICSTSTLHEFRGYYSGFSPDRFTVIHNGIDFRALDACGSQSTEHKPGHSLVFYGRLTWQKGVAHLVRSFDILRKNLPDTVLHIYGRGPMESTISRLALQLGLDDEIILHGMMPSHDELMARVRNYDVVVLPSIYEAQPVAALEAMALGKPLVMFDTPYSREFIDNMSNGVLARASDVVDLSNKIEMVLTDPALARRLSETARKHVEQHHNWDSLVERYIDVYEKLV